METIRQPGRQTAWSIEFQNSEIDRPHLNAVSFQFRKALAAGKSWRHEEYVAVPLQAVRELVDVLHQLAVVPRIHGCKGFSAYESLDDTHDVERL